MNTNPNEQLVRDYHGCRIVSTPDGLAEDRRPEGSDGWLHVLFCGDAPVADVPFHSLAAAIQAARAIPPEMKGLPPARDSHVDE